MSDNKIIYDLLKEVREDQKKQGDELKEQSKCLVSVQGDLKYHIRRTDILEKLHKDNQHKIELSEKRIDKLEEPAKVNSYLSEKWKYWTAGIVLISTVVTLITKIKGLW